MGCHSLLQGIFPTQGLNPCLLHCRQILYRLSHQGSQGFPDVNGGGRCVGPGLPAGSPVLASPQGWSPAEPLASETSTLCLTLATSWTVAHQALRSMGFPRQECWRGLPFPSPGNLPDPGIEPMSPALAGGFFTTETPEKPSQHSKHQVLVTMATVF